MMNDAYTQLFTAALQSAKLTKAQAYSTVRTLLDAVQDRDPDAESDDARHLVQLLVHFAPAKPKRPRDAWDWCALAVAGKSDSRYCLRYIYIDDAGNMVGCDGHRLHIAAAPDGVAPGYYDVRTREKVDCDAQYPDWQYVLQCTTAGYDMPWRAADCKVVDAPATKRGETCLAYHCDAMDNGARRQGVNRSYVNATGADSGTWYAAAGALLVECEHGKALIMGTRL